MSFDSHFSNILGGSWPANEAEPELNDDDGYFAYMRGDMEG